MKDRDPDSRLFDSARRAPRELQEAALILGAEEPPPDTVMPSAELLWRAARRLGKGAPDGTITASVAALVQELHEDALEGQRAARRAVARLQAAMKVWRKQAD